MIQAMGAATGVVGETIAKVLVYIIKFIGKIIGRCLALLLAGMKVLLRGIIKVVVFIINEVRWHLFTAFWLVVTGIRVVLYAVCYVVWFAIASPFSYFDSVKWYLGMFWVPQLFPYNSQPYWYLWPWNDYDDWPAPWRLDLPGGSLWLVVFGLRRPDEDEVTSSVNSYENTSGNGDNASLLQKAPGWQHWLE